MARRRGKRTAFLAAIRGLSPAEVTGYGAAPSEHVTVTLASVIDRHVTLGSNVCDQTERELCSGRIGHRAVCARIRIRAARRLRASEGARTARLEQKQG